MKSILFLFCVTLAVSAYPFQASAHPANSNSHAAEAKMRVLPVSASAEITSEPDKVAVSAGVITEGKDASAVATENAAKMTAVYAALAQAGVSRGDIKTSQLSLQPRYDYESRKKPRIVGYQATNSVIVTSYDLAKTGDIIDALVNAGANNINNIQFSLRDPEAVEAMVLDKAIRKARSKAQAMATSAGVTLGALQSLTVSGRGYSPHNQAYDEVIVTASGGGSSGGGVRTPVSYGNHTIKLTVHLVYEMR